MRNKKDTKYDKALKKTVNYAYNHFKFYRWFYKLHNVDVSKIRNIQNLSSFPILRKQDLLAFFSKRNTIGNSPLGKFVTITTTGSTGKRLSVSFTQRDLHRFLSKPCIQCLRWWGYDGKPLSVIKGEHSPDSLVGIWANTISEITGGRVYLDKEIEINLLKRDDVIKEETLTYIGLPRLLKLVNSPSRLQELKRMNLKYILTLVTPSELKVKLHVRIRQKLGSVNLIPCYGFTEALFVGGSCPYTFEEAFVHMTQPGIFQIVDEKGDLRNHGIGELVYTSLGREAFPFIKYSPGDIVTLKEECNCDCGYSGQSLRFERRLPLTVKIPHAGGYFINVPKVIEIVKAIIPGSRVTCIYGEHPHNHFLFLAIFIGISQKSLRNKKKLEKVILKKIILSHIPHDKIEKSGLSNLILKWHLFFPMFFVDVDDIPIEPKANKPRLLLNLDEEILRKSKLYFNLMSEIKKYFRKPNTF